MGSIIKMKGTSKIYNGNIHIPRDIFNEFGFKDGLILVWGINEDNELVLSKADNFNIKKKISDIESLYKTRKLY